MDAACILGYTNSEISNASLLKLLGPPTDLIILKKAVTASSRSGRVISSFCMIAMMWPLQ